MGSSARSALTRSRYAQSPSRRARSWRLLAVAVEGSASPRPPRRTNRPWCLCVTTGSCSRGRPRRRLSAQRCWAGRPIGDHSADEPMVPLPGRSLRGGRKSHASAARGALEDSLTPLKNTSRSGAIGRRDMIDALRSEPIAGGVHEKPSGTFTCRWRLRIVVDSTEHRRPRRDASWVHLWRISPACFAPTAR